MIQNYLRDSATSPPRSSRLFISLWGAFDFTSRSLVFYLFIKFPKLISFHMMAFYHLNSCSRLCHIQTKIINSNFFVHCIRENLKKVTRVSATLENQKLPGFLLAHGMYKFQHFHFLFDPLYQDIGWKQYFEFLPILGT